MGRGQLREPDDTDDIGASGKKEPSQIRNKQKRALETAKLRVEKKKAKKRRLKERQRAEEEAKALGLPPPERPIPRTIENTREYDETTRPADDAELEAGDALDELAPHFARERTPKVLITSSARPTKVMYKFVRELLDVIPGAHFYERRSYRVKEIVKFAKNREFTAVVVVNENQKTPNGLLLIALPDGPTAHFRLSSLVLRKHIKHHGRPTTHLPELILNNFTTQLGHRVSRVLASVFPQDPQYRGRRVVTFHNQRDFIFFRHHRYIFEGGGVEASGARDPEAEDRVVGTDVGAGEATQQPSMGPEQEGSNPSVKPERSKAAKSTAKAGKGSSSVEEDVTTRLQECGPRFTLKLLSLQKGTFDSKGGEYEWVHKRSLETSRRKFLL